MKYSFDCVCRFYSFRGKYLKASVLSITEALAKARVSQSDRRKSANSKSHRELKIRGRIVSLWD